MPAIRSTKVLPATVDGTTPGRGSRSFLPPGADRGRDVVEAAEARQGPIDERPDGRFVEQVDLPGEHLVTGKLLGESSFAHGAAGR